jgi:hypothetical protein
MSALQKKLLLLFALLLAVQTGVNLAKYGAELQEGGRFGGDFIGFWLAAQRARLGDIAAIYNPNAWRSLLSASHPREITWFVYPPFALFGLWPLGHMSYATAVTWWSLVPLPFYFGLTFLLAKRSGLAVGEAETPSRALAFAILAALALPLLSANLFTGQTGVFVAVLFLGAAWFWPDRPILAGLCIGALTIKPQLGLLLPFVLAASGQWRTIAAAVTTIAVLVAASTLWLGASIWTDYLQMTRIFGQFIGGGYGGVSQLALGPYVSLKAAGAPTMLAGLLQIAISLAVLGAIILVFRRTRAAPGDDGRLDLRLALLATGALLATPYSLSYDTPMLLIAIVPLFARAWRKGWDGLELAAVTALAVLPFAQPILALAHIPFGLGALLLMFCVLYRRYRLEACALYAEMMTARYA